MSHITGQEKYHNLSNQVRHLNSGNSFTTDSCWDALSVPEQIHNAQANHNEYWMISISGYVPFFGAHQMNCAQLLAITIPRQCSFDSERFSFNYTKSRNPLNLTFCQGIICVMLSVSVGQNKKIFCYIKNLRNMNWNFCNL